MRWSPLFHCIFSLCVGVNRDDFLVLGEYPGTLSQCGNSAVGVGGWRTEEAGDWGLVGKGGGSEGRRRYSAESLCPWMLSSTKGPPGFSYITIGRLFGPSIGACVRVLITINRALPIPKPLINAAATPTGSHRASRSLFSSWLEGRRSSHWEIESTHKCPPPEWVWFCCNDADAVFVRLHQHP